MSQSEVTILGWVEIPRSAAPDAKFGELMSVSVTDELGRTYHFKDVSPGHVGEDHIAFPFIKEHLVSID